MIAKTAWCRPNITLPVASDTHLEQTARYGDGSGFHGEIVRRSRLPAVFLPVPTRLIAIKQQSNGFFHDADCLGRVSEARPRPTHEGILGLAYNSLALAGTDSWFALLGPSLPDATNKFGILYCSEFEGMVYVGDSPMPSPSGFTPVLQNSHGEYDFYRVALQSLRLWGLHQNALTKFNGATIVDSGTSALVLPKASFICCPSDRAKRGVAFPFPIA